ncbi:unnamed protein product [Rhodiola kirilowii]
MGVVVKKSSKGKLKEAKDKHAEEGTAAAPIESKKRRKDEIDEIFSSKKNKKTQAAVPNKNIKGKSIHKTNAAAIDSWAQRNKSSKSDNNIDVKEKNVKRSNKLPADGDLFVDTDSSKPRKKSSGVKIYTEEELGLNRSDAGGTPLCPFDCDCCF